MATPSPRTHELLGRVERNRVQVRLVEFERLRLARDWAMEHVVTDPEWLDDPVRRPPALGAVGLPVEEYAYAEFAAALGVHPLAGRHWMADAVDLHARHPSVWEHAAHARVEVGWRARSPPPPAASPTSRLAGSTR